MDWINLIEMVFWFLISWIGIFYLHELCHAWACKMQGGKSKIEIWFYKKIIPSMKCSCSKLTDDRYFAYAGGIGSGFISTIASIPFYWIYPPLFVGLLIAGIVNFLYGIYEGTYLGRIDFNRYMKWHYVVEIGGIVIGIILLRNIIWSWII